MRRHVGGAGKAAPADVPRKCIPGRPRVTVRPYYGGLPFTGLDAGRMNAGESLRDQVGRMPSVRPRKYGPEAQNRRGGAPEGVALSGLRARRRTPPKPARAKAGEAGDK